MSAIIVPNFYLKLLINRDAPIDDQVALLERELALLRGERAKENGIEVRSLHVIYFPWMVHIYRL